MNEKQLTGTDTAPARDAQELTAEHEAQELTTAQNAQELTEEPNAADRLDFNTAADRDIDSMTLEEIEQATAGAAGRIDGKLKIQAEDLKKSLMDMIAEKNPEALQTFISVTSAISEFLKSDQYQTIKKNIEIVRAYLEQHAEDIRTLSTAAMSFAALMPFVEAELKEAIKDNPDLQRYEECTLEELIADGFDEQGRPKQGPLFQIIERAQRRHDEFIEAGGTINQIIEAGGDLEKIGAAAETLAITYKKGTRLNVSTDKLANVFFMENAKPPKNNEIHGQMRIEQLWPVKYEGERSREQLTLFYDYSYNEEIIEKYGLHKNFDDYDFFIMTILDNLKDEGNTYVSLSKIYKELGGDNKPASKQLEEVHKRLIKGMTTTIIISSADIQKAWPAGNERYNEILSPVMPIQIGTERLRANGKISDGVIKILEYSPYRKISETTRHLTAWKKSILTAYTGRKTKRYYKVLKSLMREIGYMRHGNRNTKILYSTLYDYTGDKTTRAQQLTRDLMYRLLEEVFKQENYITGYKEEAKPEAGVKLTMSNAKHEDNTTRRKRLK